MEEERIKKLIQKAESLMDEIRDEVVTPEILQKIEKKIRKSFAEKGISYSILSLKAYLEGMEIMHKAMHQDEKGDLHAVILAATQKIVSTKDKEVKATVEKTMSNVNPTSDGENPK